MLLHVSIVHFFLLLTSKYIVYEYTTSYFSILLMGIWSFMNKAIMDIFAQVFCGHMFLVFLGKYIGVEFCGLTVSACLTL